MKVRYIALVIAATLTNACDNSAPTDSEPPLRPVNTFEVTEESANRIRTFTGVSHSTQESRLSFKVGGTIVELPIKVGTSLKKGQTVARLDDSTFELEVEQARAKLVQAQANERNLNAAYSRAKGLYENANASKNELDVARANAETAEAEVSAASKAMEIAQLNRSYTRLTASADCQVSGISVDLNENIAAGAEVAAVNCGDGIKVRLGVPEGLIAGLSLGMPATVTFNAISNQAYLASITEIGVDSDISVATFPVYVTLDVTDGNVRPGMAAQVSFEFPTSQLTTTYLVPAAAVASDQQGTFVYLARPSTSGQATVVRQGVKIGELTSDGIEVLSGVNRGDLIITAGVSFVHDGQAVLLY